MIKDTPSTPCFCMLLISLKMRVKKTDIPVDVEITTGMREKATLISARYRSRNVAKGITRSIWFKKGWIRLHCKGVIAAALIFLAHTFLACSCSPALVLPNGNNGQFLLSRDWSTHFTCWRFWSYCVPFPGSKFPLRQHLWTAPCSRQLALQGIDIPGSLLETFQPYNLC